jgi:hypothetical protein
MLALLNRRQGARAALALFVAAGTTVTYLATAGAGPPPPLLVRFAVTHERPIAGKTFAGLAIIVTDPTSTKIDRVLCDAQVANNRLPARREVFFTAPSARIAGVMCTWRVPAAAGGKRLRLWDNGEGPRATVHLSPNRAVVSSPEFSWLVVR